MYEMRRLGQDPREKSLIDRSKHSLWPFGRFLIPPKWRELMLKVCVCVRGGGMSVEKERENDRHFCPHLGAEQKTKNWSTRKLQHVETREETILKVVRIQLVKK